MTRLLGWLLRALGYVARNALSDSVMMAMDGVYSFEGMRRQGD